MAGFALSSEKKKRLDRVNGTFPSNTFQGTLIQHWQNGLLPAQGFRKQHLHVAEVAFFETGFAVTEIELPHANKRIRESHSTHPVDIVEKPLPPGAKRFRIMGCDILQVHEP